MNNNLDKLDLCIYPVESGQLVEIDTCEKLEEYEKRRQIS